MVSKQRQLELDRICKCWGIELDSQAVHDLAQTNAEEQTSLEVALDAVGEDEVASRALRLAHCSRRKQRLDQFLEPFNEVAYSDPDLYRHLVEVAGFIEKPVYARNHYNVEWVADPNVTVGRFYADDSDAKRSTVSEHSKCTLTWEDITDATSILTQRESDSLNAFLLLFESSSASEREQLVDSILHVSGSLNIYRFYERLKALQPCDRKTIRRMLFRVRCFAILRGRGISADTATIKRLIRRIRKARSEDKLTNVELTKLFEDARIRVAQADAAALLHDLGRIEAA